MPYGSGHEELVLLGMEKKSMLRCDATQGITRYPQAFGSKWPRSSITNIETRRQSPSTMHLY